MQVVSQSQDLDTSTATVPAISCLFVGRAGRELRDAAVAKLDSNKAVAEVEVCEDFDHARDCAGESSFDVVVLDLSDQNVDAAAIEADWAPVAGVVLTCDPSQSATAAAMLERGADQYVVLPCDTEQLVAAITLTGRARSLALRAARLATTRVEVPADRLVVGRSPSMRRLDTAILRAAEIDATVLIEGQPGTGKSLVAHTLHEQGRRSTGPLVSLHCASVTEQVLLQACEDASRGTLLLEHIERLPQTVQSRLVRHLKERSASDGDANDARLIATTTGRLPELTSRGQFREDLFYRLNVFPMQLPLLRERTEDVAELAALFLEQASAVSGRPSAGISASAMILLETNPWPGNVAQLRNVLFRAHFVAGNQPIDRVHLIGPVMGLQAPPDAQEFRGNETSESRDENVRESDIVPFQEEEKRILARALRATKGNVRRAAEKLGIGRATLYRKIQLFELTLS